jgi:hypothetical protein
LDSLAQFLPKPSHFSLQAHLESLVEREGKGSIGFSWIHSVLPVGVAHLVDHGLKYLLARRHKPAPNHSLSINQIMGRFSDVETEADHLS